MNFNYDLIHQQLNLLKNCTSTLGLGIFPSGHIGVWKANVNWASEAWKLNFLVVDHLNPTIEVGCQQSLQWRAGWCAVQADRRDVRATGWCKVQALLFSRPVPTSTSGMENAN